MNQCTIYKLINRLNGKMYIGQTWQTLENRFNNGVGYIGCHHLYNAIKKYGKEQFYYEVLAICFDQEVANKLESVMIEYYGTRNQNIGYNLIRGGIKKSNDPALEGYE
jgi:group I intron endonuclease